MRVHGVGHADFVRAWLALFGGLPLDPVTADPLDQATCDTSGSSYLRYLWIQLLVIPLDPATCDTAGSSYLRYRWI